MKKDRIEGFCLFLAAHSYALCISCMKLGSFAASSWKLALVRLPLGYLVGIICDLCICTPLSRKIVARISKPQDSEWYQVFLLRFCMVVLMTVVMTIFGIVASGETGMAGVRSFFVYLPYNFTIAMPIQMIIVAPLSLRLARFLAHVTEGRGLVAVKE